MYLELATLAIILGRYIYHRLTEEDPPRPDRIRIARIEEGDVTPLVYGRVRVKSPIIGFALNSTAIPAPPDPPLFLVDVMYVVGVPFFNGTTRLEGIFFSDHLATTVPSLPNPWNFAPNINAAVGVARDPASAYGPGGVILGYTELFFEFGDGRSTQNFVPSGARAAMNAAGIIDDAIPSFRGYATLFVNMGTRHASLPSLSFEISTYPDPLLLTSLTSFKIGVECNPIHVLIDIIARFADTHGQLGKLGGSSVLIDSSSFLSAARTLQAEQHGYSRVIDSGRSADDVIQEILRQIDGALYEDARTGTFKIKLIRPDYDPRTIPHVDVDNCEGLLDFAAAGWTNIVNKIRVVFTDRSRNYLDGSAVAHNQANAVGQDSEVNELVLHYPGVCTQALADEIAARELAARSRPMAKFKAVVNRDFYRVNQGDAVSMSWPDANIGNMVFRVGNISQSTADRNVLVLDLVQDFFYVHRAIVDTSGQTAGSGAFPGAASVG